MLVLFVSLLSVFLCTDLYGLSNKQYIYMNVYKCVLQVGSLFFLFAFVVLLLRFLGCAIRTLCFRVLCVCVCVCLRCSVPEAS